MSTPEPKSSDPLLEVKDLRVEYLTRDGDICAVEDVSFSIARGEIFGLAGESGSGKTTIVKAIMRLLEAPAAITDGSVICDGQDLLAMDEKTLRHFRWSKVSMVTQSAMNALNPVMTIAEQICDVIEAHQRSPRKQSLQRAAHLLKLVGIDTSRLNSYPHELSGGMRQRVVIAIALALEPPLILMDEPTTALDVVVQKEILEQISSLQKELGFSVLFITHDLSLMLELCTRVGILYAGRLMETAPSRLIFENASHPYTRGLMASHLDVHGERRALKGIPGSPPSLKNPPNGCRFHPRCERSEARCNDLVPELLQLAPAHQAACHLIAPEHAETP